MVLFWVLERQEIYFSNVKGLYIGCFGELRRATVTFLMFKEGT